MDKDNGEGGVLRMGGGGAGENNGGDIGTTVIEK